MVRNGTNASVVLDCAYTLPADDTLLHVKWFHIRTAYTLVFQVGRERVGRVEKRAS